MQKQILFKGNVIHLIFPNVFLQVNSRSTPAIVWQNINVPFSLVSFLHTFDILVKPLSLFFTIISTVIRKKSGRECKKWSLINILTPIDSLFLIKLSTISIICWTSTISWKNVKQCIERFPCVYFCYTHNIWSFRSNLISGEWKIPVNNLGSLAK